MQYSGKQRVLSTVTVVIMLLSLSLAGFGVIASKKANCIGFVNSNSTEFRKMKNTSSELIATFSKGKTISILSQDDDYYEVSVSGRVGYIKVSLVSVGSESGMMFSVKDEVNVRAEANTSASIVGKLSKGQSVTVTGINKDFYWYSITFDNNTKGYVRADMLGVEEYNTSTIELSSFDSSNNEEEGIEYFSDDDDIPLPVILADKEKVSSSSKTLEAQKMLKSLSFFYHDPDGKIGNASMSAIKAFQYSHQLEPDGLLGTDTMEKLKVVASDGKTKSSAAKVDVSSNGVILAEWFNFMKYHFPRYVPLRVVDVESGTEFKLRAFATGNHADVETPTKEDTDILFKLNGNKWSWDPRPVWVYIDGVAYAAVINVQPHGPDTVSNNGMDGQICMHFLYSRNHNTGQENKNMQQGILKSFEAAELAPLPAVSDFFVPQDLPQE